MPWSGRNTIDCSLHRWQCRAADKTTELRQQSNPTAADVSRGWHSTILAQFETLFIAMESPSGMAMFATDFSGLAACLYFSPATAKYAPGEPITLLAGDPNGRSQIPPEVQPET